MKGYYKVDMIEALACATTAKKHIEKERLRRDKVFVENMIPYFKRVKGRFKWWQFWKVPLKYFENKEIFSKLWHNRYPSPGISVLPKDELAFKKFEPQYKSYRSWGLRYWYPSVYQRNAYDLAKQISLQCKEKDGLYLDADSYGRLRYLCDYEF